MYPFDAILLWSNVGILLELYPEDVYTPILTLLDFIFQEPSEFFVIVF